MGPVSVNHLHIPEDVVISILSRLPVKALIRFRCVSKSWHSLIADSNFITTHLNMNRSISSSSSSSSSSGIISNLYVLRHLNDRRFVALDKDFVERTELVAPVENPSIKNLQIVGSINGIVCLYGTGWNNQFNEEDYYLWNPLARILKTLEKPNFQRMNMVYNISGFGFHSQTNDYKILRTGYLDQKGSQVVEVYSLAMDSWKKINASFPYSLNSLSGVAFVNGALHFLGYEFCFINSVIISFDTGEEKFREVMLPSDLRVQKAKGVFGLDESILSLKGLLAIFLYNGPNPLQDHDTHSYLWVMTEYGVSESWVKQYAIETEFGIEWFMGFTDHRGELFVQRSAKRKSYSSRLNVCVVESGEIKDIGDLGSRKKIVSFTESLVLLTELRTKET